MCDRRYQRTGAGSTVTDSHHTSWHQPGSCVQQIWVSGGWRCVGSSPQCVCTSFSWFFLCVCVCELFMCLSACVCTIWFLKAKRWLPRWSWAVTTRVVVLRQRAGNLNLYNPCLQLLDLLPQEPGLVLHALHFFPHPAEHYHYNNLHRETQVHKSLMEKDDGARIRGRVAEQKTKNLKTKTKKHDIFRLFSKILDKIKLQNFIFFLFFSQNKSSHP